MNKYYGLKVDSLKCNYMENPLGVDCPLPKLSWILNAKERGQQQKAYRILAASSKELLGMDKGDLWDTGKVISGCSVHIPYQGKPLGSMNRCYWKVRIWDVYDKASEWSEDSYFEMGLLNKEDWLAKWIGTPVPWNWTWDSAPDPAPMLRKSFLIGKKIVKARVYVCGLGYYELYINGSKASDDVLAPAVTRYDCTLLYNTYDITPMIKQGENILGAILGNGWYNGFTSDAWNYKYASWRHHPKLLLQLHIVLEDGTDLVVTSDTTWKISSGPIIFDGLRNGEYYDARLEKPGWNLAGYDDSKWENVKIARSPGGVLRSFQMPPIKVTGTIRPVSCNEVKPGVWIYDIGQNISGWARLNVSGHSGTEITLKYGEKLNADGTLDQVKINEHVKSGEFQTDKYILKGDGVEVWEPRFTYHGFQYVQVTGLPVTPALDSVCGRVVHTALDTRGSFECSNELLNKIQSCVRWSTLTNYHGIPTDCPHREKNGWTGDALLSSEQTLLNFDPMSSYIKWLRDFKDVQRPSGHLPGIVPTGGWGYETGGPAWDSAVILIPWNIYLYCGDKSILDEMYINMKSHMDYLVSMSDDYIVGFGFGDWCPPIGAAYDYKCPVSVTDTAFFYMDALVMTKISELLGKKEETELYGLLAEKIRYSFRTHFLDINTGLVGRDCQTSTACALYHGFVDKEEEPRVFGKLLQQVALQNNHIDCGILGTKYVLETLSDMGRVDLAYKIATQTTFPSWGHWISQGATTLWESWGGTSSRNHHMFSSISAWFYKSLAGINPDPENPGFKHIIFRPHPVLGFDWVKCSHDSLYGRIECNWWVNNGRFNITVKVPSNCTATLCMPAEYSGQVIELESGEFEFFRGEEL